MAQYDLDLRDYWRVLRRRKSLIIVTILLTAMVSYLFAKLNEPKALYEATASVKVEKVNNLANVLLGLFSWSPGDNIATQAATITSFPVMADTCKKLGRIPQEVSLDDIQADSKYLSEVENLKNSVVTEQVAQTSIIDIVATTNSPEKSAKIANTVAASYRNYNILERNRQTLETRDFIEKQLALVTDRLDNSEKKLLLFMKANDAISLDDQESLYLRQFDNLERDYFEYSTVRDSKYKELQKLLKMQDSPEDLTESFYAEDSRSLLRELTGRLSQLNAQRTTLLLDYTPQNPQVLQIEGQIAGLVKEIRQEITSQVNMLQTRENFLKNRMGELQSMAQDFPDKSMKLSRLERAVDVYQTLYKELETKYQEILIRESAKIEEVSVIQPAMPTNKPVNIPSKAAATATGAIIGLILGAVLAFIVETLDTSIGTIEDIEDFLQVSVLGVIPFSIEEGKAYTNGSGGKKERSPKSLITHFQPKSPVSEAFRSLRTNLQYTGARENCKTYMVTSASLQEGKTYNASNLALSMAQAGDRVLLVEADLRRPLIHKMIGLKKEPGLTDFVLGNYSWQEVTKSIVDIMLGEFDLDEIMQTPGLDNLHVITAGASSPNPAEILRSPRFKQFLDEARDQFDVVIVDAPPVLPVADAAVVGAVVDRVVIVYEVGKVARGILRRAKMTLDNVNANVEGVVLNNIKPDVSPDFYGYNYLYYGYGTDDENEGGKLFEG